MKGNTFLAALCSTLTLGFSSVPSATASLVSYTSPTGPTSSGLNDLPPAPSAGESPGQWIDQIFDTPEDETNSTAFNMSAISSSVDSTSNKNNVAALSEGASKRRRRAYEEVNGLHESTWTNDTANIGYNISVDLSGCNTGLKYTTNIGVYTFTNGTTSNSTTLKDMVTDIWTLKHSRTTPNIRYANHTGVLAQLAMDEANAVLGNGLACLNQTTSLSITQPPDMLIHTELRKLLANAHSYWSSVVLSAAFGAAVGAGLAAGLDHHFKGNVTAENAIQTGAVIAVVIIIGGILNRMHEVGRLDRADRLGQNAQRVGQNAQRVGQVVAANVNQLAPAGREAIVQNVFLGRVRAALQRMARRHPEEVVEALEDAGVMRSGDQNPAGGNAVGGGMMGSTGASFGGSVAGDRAVSESSMSELTALTTTPLSASALSDVESCLEDISATDAASAMAAMNTDAQLETIQEIERQFSELRDKQEACDYPE
ncbi:hypothetical protein MMC21_004863 [Puttea exsequens]|nr:hypothetical protein [Puttea exsequens]